MTDADKSFLEAARTGDTGASIFVTMCMNGHAQCNPALVLTLVCIISDRYHNMNIKICS